MKHLPEGILIFPDFATKAKKTSGSGSPALLDKPAKAPTKTKGRKGKGKRKLAKLDADKHFWANVSRKNPDGCHTWTGKIDPTNGYGRLWNIEGMPYAHRLAWTLAHGRKVPKGKLVRHTCDNTLCMNPDHLEVGTQKQNMQDCVDRGRHGKRKLKPADVHEILRLCYERGLKYNAIGKKFGVSPQHVMRICKGTRRAKDTRELLAKYLAPKNPPHIHFKGTGSAAEARA